MADAAPHTDSLKSIVTFEDVFIRFTREEWDLLTESQKRLYHKTMVDNFALVMSVGLESSRYRLISPPEPESAPEVPARIGIAAAVEEGIMNDTNPPGIHFAYPLVVSMWNMTQLLWKRSRIYCSFPKVCVSHGQY
ncbi:hypothetical protein MG293_005819 [Ovis ammon polii]|uniref:KRAB domain-containing protein n=1 Tax=Ovis ammon polii TaxID=230172 RepID=A0AAD4UE48_OVIAM|nr:hypothetical protein MG293_005819 [Ovis ammon polii]